MDISNDLDGPLTRFQGHGIFEANWLQKCRVNKDNTSVLLQNDVSFQKMIRLMDKVSTEHS